MTVTVRHEWESGAPDGPDPTKLQPSHWNADHEVVDVLEMAPEPELNHAYAVGDRVGVGNEPGEVWVYQCIVAGTTSDFFDPWD